MNVDKVQGTMKKKPSKKDIFLSPENLANKVLVKILPSFNLP